MIKTFVLYIKISFKGFKVVFSIEKWFISQSSPNPKKLRGFLLKRVCP
ncbi:hypothetical protein N403_04810 [Helicobacter pylori FD430]|nr:hypothetical protein N403_04810 [Helicobacter pylori FD430]